ncbi:hypothetical protein HMF8227_01442 [Saliniradius amylolyticus]|uniref:Uncharacterized protein n=2 Tax=Saliniradius amylolyticus TaxID=2183582 RepID=A0A2S2E4J2_9ALTE|nr:hypothetical protein HMF8227_01442 [Saliniradius amylolyticus]
MDVALEMIKGGIVGLYLVGFIIFFRDLVKGRELTWRNKLCLLPVAIIWPFVVLCILWLEREKQG